MNLHGLLAGIRSLPEYGEALDAIRRPGRAGRGLALRLPRSARVPVTAALTIDYGRPVLVITARADRAATYLEELPAWAPDCPVLGFPEPNPLFYEYSGWGPATIHGRLSVLSVLAARSAGLPQERPPIIIASARALMSRSMPRQDFLANTRVLRPGEPVRLEKLLEGWVGAGYSSATIVTEPGQFARRGGIIDIYPAAAERPVRLELFGDEIETLREFEAASQRSGGRLDEITITPAREALPRLWQPEWTPEITSAGEAEGARADLPESNLEFYLPRMYPPAGVLEYLPDDALVLVDDWRELSDTISELEEQAVQLRDEQQEAGLVSPEFPLPYHTWADLQDELTDRGPGPIVMSTPDIDEGETVDMGARFRPGPRYGGQLKPLLDHLRELRSSQDRAVVVTRQAQRLAEMWGAEEGYSTPASQLPGLPPQGSVAFVQGALADGWRLQLGRPADSTSSLHLLTDAEIFGWARPDAQRARRRGRPVARAPEATYADLNSGDYVVHMDFGIGRFQGLVQREVEGLEREYMLIEYAQGDELYVPIHQADRLTRYIGGDETHSPGLSRLGSADWTTTKARTQQVVEAVAHDLLELYAQRESVHGHSFGADTHWQTELEASFPYVETEDQLRAIREVKADMESPRPMDRLICGDVGYGKTEVALRAAFKGVLDGYQVAMLVPTTVLAQQHLHTFQARLAPYPVQVDVLSRFRSRAEADDVIERLAGGKIDILIGTHRLLQKDVHFRNLGLVIIDEEQRFGVTHKEYLKKLRTEVDVLTLTATPIPRTLYLSLTGVRDISTINTPPEERLPIVTHVGPSDERLIRQAILRELDRDGQVFFVHNRVQSIGVIRQKLEQLVPEANIGVGHGQMDERELARVMDEFTNGNIDVLLCTSIIESGLDIPNANTLMVDRADTFGLAQLYQLRGRVGRAAARAYAYFFTDLRNRPTPEAYQRLETLAEQTDLGAGYGIAMRDLEMRGAGDILGMRQHGHIAAVGFHLYTRLLADAVKQLRLTAPAPTSAAENGEREPAATFGASAPSGTLALPDAAAARPVSVDLPISAVIPADYVADRGLRLRLYRRMADIRTEDEIAAVAVELADRFGPISAEVENFLFQLQVKILAGRAGVSAISSDNGQIVVTIPDLLELDQVDLAVGLSTGMRTSKNKIWLGRMPAPQDPKAAWRRQLLNVLRTLASIRGGKP